MTHLTKGTVILMDDYPDSRFEVVSFRKYNDEYVYTLRDLNEIEDDLEDIYAEEFGDVETTDEGFEYDEED